MDERGTDDRGVRVLLADTNSRFVRHLPEAVIVAGALTFLGLLGQASETPAWMPGVLVMVAWWAISFAFSAWRGSSRREIHLRMAVQTAGITAVVYATGWGPALAWVVAFGVADQIKWSGTRAARPALAWSAAGIGGGQVAIAAGVAPSYIAEPAVHGLAVMVGLGLAMVVHRFARATAEKENAQAALTDREARFGMLVQHSSDVILIVDDRARITYISPSVERVFGWRAEEVEGMRFLDLVHPEDLPQLTTFAAEVAGEPGLMPLVECRLRAKDGTWRHVESVGNNLLHDPSLRGFVLNTRDVTDRKSLESQLEYRAFHDELTRLANRALFTDRVEHAVARVVDRRAEPIAVLFLDLDGFKNVNDRLGHATGDELLVQVADRLRTCLRDADTAARLGGDEFAVLLEDMADESGPARVAERILKTLRQPFDVAGTEVTIDASIGIAAATGGETAEDVLRNADIAMYTAKGSGKGRYDIFEPRMHAAVVERLELESDLARAIDADEFVLHYQPIVELASKRIKGVEALARWEHPTRGMVSPADFIPLAEETGLIVELGRWVLREACDQMVEWQHDYVDDPPMSMSVNLSAKQLLDPRIVSDVRAALTESGLDPVNLTLEITESALVTDTEATINSLTELKALGVKLAIDDFGTGYSSLSYLQRFPIDVLKIDRSFIDQVGDRPANPALARAIVELGHSLELETVAEGIERDDQLVQFQALQCHSGQGYLFARPGDRDGTAALLARQAFSRDARSVSLPSLVEER
ncbi:MAG: EAL domain-containing protein [Actinobacteria bacterium]|nr:EAL domain-containing protein [Actinomycetota bacterium]